MERTRESPTFTWVEKISPAEEWRAKRIADHLVALVTEPKPTPIKQHKPSQDPTRKTALTNKVVKSRKAAKAARKARKK